MNNVIENENMMTANRVLVAGATGYLGGFVTKELNKRGHDVRALARSQESLAKADCHFDEAYIGQITEPETLKGVCNNIDVVFSSVGITKQKGNLTFKDVDYQGNKNLLEEAKRAGVKKFVYVSVLNGQQLCHLDIVKAHEDFVDELKASGLEYCIVRPTGYFSDMGEFFEMAKKGRVYLIGSGETLINPIHGADLAVSCVDAIEDDYQVLEVGGPEVMTWRQAAEIALKAAENPVKITTIPVWMMNFIKSTVGIFSRHQAELLAFFITMSTQEVVGPATGNHTLRTHYETLGEIA